MNRKNNTLTKDQIQVHIERLVQHRMFNDALMTEHKRMREAREDFQSLIILELARQVRGYDSADEMLQEGVWDSIKKFVTTNPFKSRGDDGEAQGALKAALGKASNQLMAQQFQQIEKALPGWPNVKDSKEFMQGVILLGTIYESVKDAAIQGEIDIVEANGIIDAFRKYLENAEAGLKYTSRYFNENEDEDGEPLDEATPESFQEARVPKGISKFINFNKWSKLNKKRMMGNASDREVAWLDRKETRLDNEVSQKGIENLTPKERAVYDKMHADPDVSADDFDIGPDNPAGGQNEFSPDAAGGGDELTQADFGIRGDGDSMMGLGGRPQGTGDSVLNTTKHRRYLDMMKKTGLGKGTGDIGGMQDIGKLFKAAGGDPMKLISNLGGAASLAKGIAGIGIPLIGAGALAGLLAKRWLGHSREGTLKKSIKAVQNITPDMIQVSPEQATQIQKKKIADPDGDPQGQGGGGKTVNVFKGKGGAGMQSTFAKAGIAGKDMSALLKGLKADLSGAGFTVLQEKSRERISLSNTLAAVQQIADAEQQEAAKAAIVALLKQHGIVGDNEFSMAMRPGAAGAEGGAAGGGSADQWIAAGKPELDNVGNNNLASRDADNITKGPNGEEIFTPAALEFAKAQVAWFEKNGQQAPGLLTTRITATETAGAAPSEPPEQAADAPVQGEPPQGETPTTPPVSPQAPEDDAAALARAKARGGAGRARTRGRSGMEENIEHEVICEDTTYARWQKIAGIIQG